MKTILRLVLISTILLQISCDREYEDLNSLLNGVWIHAETKTDTMDFTPKFLVSEKTFELKRGKEVQEGEELPKIGSGSYVYEIRRDAIYIRYLLSSSTELKPWYFKIYPDRKSFDIGNFTPFDGESEVNKFIRIDE